MVAQLSGGVNVAPLLLLPPFAFTCPNPFSLALHCLVSFSVVPIVGPVIRHSGRLFVIVSVALAPTLSFPLYGRTGWHEVPYGVSDVEYLIYRVIPFVVTLIHQIKDLPTDHLI